VAELYFRNLKSLFLFTFCIKLLVALSCRYSLGSSTFEQTEAAVVVGISGAYQLPAKRWSIEDNKQFISRFYEHLAHGNSANKSLV